MPIISMANEWILRIETHPAIPFTCADGTGIAKGAVCKLTSPMTASLSDGDNDIFACVVQSEKIASDGFTTVSGYRGGIFECTVNGTCSKGDPLVTDSSTGGANKVALAATNEENVIAIALQDGTDEQRILVELRPTTMQLA